MKPSAVFGCSLAALLIWTGSAGAQQPPSGMPDLTRARPAIHPFSAAEIDRVSGASGLTDCFWVGTLSPTTFNILIPDTSLVYWITQFRLPAGARLEFKGQYPHGRYLSFNSYNPTGPAGRCPERPADRTGRG